MLDAPSRARLRRDENRDLPRRISLGNTGTAACGPDTLRRYARMSVGDHDFAKV